MPENITEEIRQIGQQHNWDSQELDLVATNECFFGSRKKSDIACAAMAIAIELETWDDWWVNR